MTDVAQHGERLLEAGTDLLVDRGDADRAIAIIRSITKGKLRFALDTAGKETAAHLQACLGPDEHGREAHLVGLTGLPKTTAPGVKHHIVPIKIFHEAHAIGECMMLWLERLLQTQALKPPVVDIAKGGLGGINDALDKLRSRSVSGRRIVVPLTKSDEPEMTGTSAELAYAEKLNSDPDRLKFA